MSEAHSIDSLSEEAFGWYVAGLTDGEGCFLLTRRIDSASRRRSGINRSWQIRFDIAMRDDERPHLEAIARRAGCGKIFLWPPQRERWGGKASWTTWRLEELATVIVPHFRRYPLQLKKARDFVLWEQAVLCLRKARAGIPHKGQRRISAGEDAFLAALAAQLRDVKKYRSDTPVNPPAPPPSRQPELFQGW